MRSATLSNAALAATLTSLASAQGSYVLKDDLSYKNFFQNFNFFSGPDPTNGFVQYQTKDAATQNNLIGYLEDAQSVFLGVDYKTKDPKGRASVRIESTKTWNKGLLIADIKHMPESTCGTWPAYWLLGQQVAGTDDWPKGGEIDILEGVNLDASAAVTLHTSTGCTVNNATSPIQSRAESAFMGNMATSNCDVAAEGQDKNKGCSIQAPELTASNGMATYGTDFNAAGGGVYAMEWTSSSISVWFLPRNSTAIGSGAQSLDPSTFGTPLAKFQGQGCDFEERFKNMRIIFDTTFCGDWAGRTWEASTCAAKTGAATCQEYVQNNPEAFTNAYWEVAGLKWFEKQDGSAIPAPSVPVVSPSPVASSVPVVSASSVPILSALPGTPPIPVASSVPVASVPVASVPVASASSIPTLSALPGKPPSLEATPNPASPPISAPSGPLSSPTSAPNPVPSAVAPASSSTGAAAASSSVAAVPAPGTGAEPGPGSEGGSSPNMGGFIWPTAHAGGGSPAASNPGASSPAASIPAASIPAVSPSPVASSPLLNAPTQAANAVASPVVASPADAATPSAATPSSAASSTATASPTSSAGSGSGATPDGPSPNMQGFIWPRKHLSKRVVSAKQHRGRAHRW